MKNRKETFEKITKGKDSGKYIRTLIQEEVVELNIDEIDRMEKNARRQIEISEQIIAGMNKKLEECARLRELL